MDDHTFRLMPLRLVVDYVCREMEALVPPAKSGESDSWLDSLLQMSQFRKHQGPYIFRALYTVPANLGPTTLPVLVREVTWERSKDIERCREGAAVAFPDVTAGYFEFPRRQLAGLSRTVAELERALRSFQFKPSGLRDELRVGDLVDDELHQEAADDDQPPPAAPPSHRWVSIATVPASHLELGFVQSVLPEFDHVWESVWNALGECSKRGNEAEGYVEKYWVEPREYASLLSRALRS